MATNGANGQSAARAGEKEKIPLTREGYEEKKARLQYLVTERRQQVADYIHEAKEAGDISESSAYEDAKNLQAMIEGEIQELRLIVENAVIIDTMEAPDGKRVVRLGSTVEVETPRGLKTMTLVSTVEANSAQSKVSDQSPVGRALMGRSEGDKVEITTPGGPQTYTVRAIK
jgi:transcription elongation factor GreA